MNQQNPSKISNIIKNNNKHSYSNFLKNNQYSSFKLQNIANNIIKAYFTNNSNNNKSILISDPTYKHSNNKVEINFYYYMSEKANTITTITNINITNITNITTIINNNTDNTNTNTKNNSNSNISNNTNANLSININAMCGSENISKSVVGQVGQIGQIVEIGEINEINKVIPVVDILSILFKKEVSINITNIKYPYINATIIAQYLGINASTNTFLHFSESILNTGLTESGNIINIINDNTKIESGINSSITHVRVSLSGRLITEQVVPRITKKSSRISGISSQITSESVNTGNFDSKYNKGVIPVVDYGKYTYKNNLGTFTIKI